MEPTKALGSIGWRSPSLSSSIIHLGFASTRTISLLPGWSGVARSPVGRVSPGSSFTRPPDGPWACDAGAGQGLGRSAPERVGRLDGIAPGDLGRGVAHVAGELF